MPCSAHFADQPRGVTCTTIRRLQCGQNLGGSMARAAAQAA